MGKKAPPCDQCVHYEECTDEKVAKNKSYDPCKDFKRGSFVTTTDGRKQVER